MKKILKRIAVSMLILLFLVVAIGSVLVFSRKDTIQELLIEELNDQLATTVRVGDIRFGLIQHFPNVTARFHDVLVAPVPEFTDPESLGISPDTLLYARELHVLLNPLKLLQKKIDLKRLDLRQGTIHLARNGTGLANYTILKRAPDSTRKKFNLSVDQIYLKETALYYEDDRSGLLIRGEISDLRIHFRGRDPSFQSKGDLRIDSIRNRNKLIIHDQTLSFQSTLLYQEDTTRITSGALEWSGNKFDLSGYLVSSKPAMVDLAFSSRNKKLDAILQIFPPPIQQKLAGFRVEGRVSIDGAMKGIMGPDQAPQLDVRFNIQDGSFRNDSAGLVFRDASLSGTVHQDLKKQSKNNRIEVNAFRLRFNQDIISGSFSLHDFANPEMALAVSGNIDVEALHRLLPIKKVAVLSGSVRSNVRLSGRLNALQDFTLNDLELFEPVGHLELHNVRFKTTESRIEYSSINGSVMLGRHFWLDGVSLRINENQVHLNGELRNILPYLNGRQEPVLLKATLQSPKFDLNRLIPEDKNAATGSGNHTILRFPEHILANIEFEADRFAFRKFSAEGFKGILLYEPGTLYLDSLTFRSMKGVVKGHGVARKKSADLFDMQVYSELREIDITDLFQSFNNFGQQFIIDDNLKGQLSGDVYFFSDWTSGLKIQKNSIIADAHLLIENGELVGFEPIQSLSKYLAVKELENIQFSTLENEIFINEQVVTIPLMDIASSAFTITASGTHRFNNQFEYKLKVLLSDILATKARRAKKEISEFGIIEDDGLGRTSLFFKVTGVPGDVNVAYDQQAMVQSVRSQIKNEGQNLRNILREEFGRNAQDTVSGPDIPEKKKFRIRWDEAESEKTDTARTGKKKKFNISWEESAADTSKKGKK